MVTLGARVEHPTFGEGIIADEEGSNWTVFFRSGDQSISKSFDNWTVLAYGWQPEESESGEEAGIDTDLIMELMRDVLEESNAITFDVELADRWEGGTVILKPADESLKTKEIPLETFWHKIVMMRDRLRVLEQNINSHKVMTDQDKIQLQQYITRCYGSMTTFNILFRFKEDQFKGESKSGS